MDQFLSITVFSWISSIFVVFFRSSFFCVTLYVVEKGEFKLHQNTRICLGERVRTL